MFTIRATLIKFTAADGDRKMMCDVKQRLLPVEIMWRPAQMARWFGGLNATHSHLWDLCVWLQALEELELHTLCLKTPVCHRDPGQQLIAFSVV